MQPLGEMRRVILAVQDIDASCRFYEQNFGMKLKFRDANRWAAFDAGVFEIALAGEDQRPPGTTTAIAVKVSDVGMALARVTGGGAIVVEHPARGPHEVRAAFGDLDGHLFYVYSALPEG